MSHEKEKKVTEITREELLKAGRAQFDELSAPDSGIRGFSEARRSNSADDYNRVATSNAFEAGLPEDVRRLGQIADRYAKVSHGE